MDANARLKSFVERIERLDEEAEALSNDKRDVYAEAKSDGFDLPALKAVIAKRRKRRKDPDKYEEKQSLVELYEAALESGTAVATRAPARSAKPSVAPSDEAAMIFTAPPPDDDLGIPPFLDRRGAA